MIETIEIVIWAYREKLSLYAHYFCVGGGDSLVKRMKNNDFGHIRKNEYTMPKM